MNRREYAISAGDSVHPEPFCVVDVDVDVQSTRGTPVPAQKKPVCTTYTVSVPFFEIIKNF
jgi:hypothetical protein